MSKTFIPAALNQTSPLDMTADEADRFYTALQQRITALREHPEVQRILSAVERADRATLRRLSLAWQEHYQHARNQQTQLWHKFVRSYGEHWRNVSTLGYEVKAIVRSHPAGEYTGAMHAAADAVKAVHMAGHLAPVEVEAFTRPWRAVMQDRR
jgi:hypothetical protein